MIACISNWSVRGVVEVSKRQGSAEQCTQKARPHAAISAQFASNGGSGSEQLGVLCCVGTVGVGPPLPCPWLGPSI